MYFVVSAEFEMWYGIGWDRVGITKIKLYVNQALS